MKLSDAQRALLLEHERGLGEPTRIVGGHIATLKALERMGLVHFTTDGPEPAQRASMLTPLGESTVQALLETEASA